jgi:microcompartment protein CcmK/EutM
VQLGRVVGRIWSSVKDPGLEAQRLLLVQPVKPDLSASGKIVICTDCTGAGTDEVVYWVRGREASFPFQPGDVPTDATIVGIVDELHVDANAVGKAERGRTSVS